MAPGVVHEGGGVSASVAGLGVVRERPGVSAGTLPTDLR